MSKTIKIVLGLLVLVAVILGIALFATRGIVEAAQKQLAAIRGGDVEKAYYTYTSKDFQNTTSLEAFKNFLEAYPSLKNNESASFNSRKVENNIGTLEGSLKSKEGAVTPVTYKLVKEGGEWKILGIELSASVGIETTQETGEGQILNILVSDMENDRGAVVQNKDVLATTTPEIFLSVYLKNMEKGASVSAEFVLVNTRDKLGPVTNVMDKSGDVISNFSFTKPTNDWPAGNYRIVVKLSTGQTKEITFSMM